MSTAGARLPEPDRAQPLSRDVGCELEAVDCLLCGSSESETVVIAPDPVTGRGGNFRVVRCRDCGLTYTNPRPTLASIGQFYPQDYAPHVVAPRRKGWLVRRRNAAIGAWLRTRFGFPPQPTGVWTRLHGMLSGLLSNRRHRRLLSIPSEKAADCWTLGAEPDTSWNRCGISAGKWKAWTSRNPVLRT